MSETDNDISFIHGEPIEKDWNWWSYFLQRRYYGAPEELANWRATTADIARAIELKPGMRVLDLGSGCGELSIQLALRGADVLGLELSEPLVESCVELAREREVKVTFVAADMFTFEPEGSFDAILSLNTSFGYGTDQQNRDLIGRVGRWLKPGGIFYCDLISSDRAEAFGCWNDTVAGGQFVVDNSYDTDQHIMTSYPTWIAPDNKTIYTAEVPEIVRLYSRADMEDLMRNAGMTPQRQERAMGRRFRQTDEQMLTTWIARRDAV
ncbi:MAG: ubiG 2 [Chlorobi bacterium]|nr:ubiG 2 [Chlorobiota bacterium]